MAEFGGTVSPNIGFNLFPVTFIVPHLFEVRAYGDQFMQRLDLRKLAGQLSVALPHGG